MRIDYTILEAYADTVNAFRSLAALGVVFTADQKRTIHQIATSQGDLTTMRTTPGRTLGQALFDAGYHHTIAKGHQFFETGELIQGDFDPAQHQQVRRWGQPANTGSMGVSKGTMEGGELKPSSEELARWLREQHPDWGVDPGTLDSFAINDVMFVKALNGDQTVFAADLFPWRQRTNPIDGGSGQEPAGDDILRRLDDLERRVSELEGK